MRRIAATAILATLATAPASAAVLTVLASFNGTNGNNPGFGLLMDSAGNLLGTTYLGGASNAGTIYELTNTGGTYASSPTALYSFSSGNAAGTNPLAGLVADTAGNLFGATRFNGGSGGGAIFEIANTGGSYATTPSVLAAFNNSAGLQPSGTLAIAPDGSLYGTTGAGGATGNGTVFALTKSAGSYTTAPAALASFTSSTGTSPYAGVLIDSAGNLLGTTFYSGPSGNGTVYELAKTAGTYASTPNVLVAFPGSSGRGSASTLIADAAGNLYGTTYRDGTSGVGTIFEIAKTSNGYATSETVLANFNGTTGSNPYGNLTMDADGSLYGTTQAGGTSNLGTVFKLAKSLNGYASTPTVLANFDGTNGASPSTTLVADAAGNLYGTTAVGGASNNGTIFEITGASFATPAPEPTTMALVWASLLPLIRRRRRKQAAAF